MKRFAVVGLLVVWASASSVARAQTVVALWHMDERAGTVMHDATGSHDGTIHRAVLGVSAFRNDAYGFNGTSAYVSVPSSPALNPGSATFTIVSHVKLSTRPKAGDFDVVKKGDYATSGGEYKIEILQNGQAQCAFKGSQHYAQISGGPNLATDHWYTITCTKTATAVKLTVAGKSFVTTRAVGTIANNAPVGIAAGPGMDYYQGDLDEIQISTG
jgi:hypothetical protein